MANNDSNSIQCDGRGVLQVHTDAMQLSRQAQSELYVHAWPYSCHGQSAGAAATKVAAMATAARRVDLMNCIVLREVEELG